MGFAQDNACLAGASPCKQGPKDTAARLRTFVVRKADAPLQLQNCAASQWHSSAIYPLYRSTYCVSAGAATSVSSSNISSSVHSAPVRAATQRDGQVLPHTASNRCPCNPSHLADTWQTCACQGLLAGPHECVALILPPIDRSPFKPRAMGATVNESRFFAICQKFEQPQCQASFPKLCYASLCMCITTLVVLLPKQV